MDMRPTPAHWFEVVVPKEDADDAMEALARSGAVQFEWTGDHSAASAFESVRTSVARYRVLAAEYARYWPEPVFGKRCCTLPVAPSAKAAVRAIDRWRAAARPQLERLRGLDRELADLDTWAGVLGVLSDAVSDLRALARAGPALRGFCLLLPENEHEGSFSGPSIDGILQWEGRLDHKRVFLGLVAAARVDDLYEIARVSGGHCLRLFDWFEKEPSTCLAALPAHRADVAREAAQVTESLAASALEEGVDRAVGVLERIDWFRSNAENMRCTGHYCWVSGWTSQEDAGAMNQALREVGVRASVSLLDPPLDAESPSVTHNPGWLAPFEVFTQVVGVPAVREADPTTWVALLVPLLFGYMCGDVGHGLVILSAGMLLRPKTNLWPLLVFAGASSMAFGFAYGDVFGYERLIDPLWLRPLDEPFTVLLAPVVAGALVLNLGIVLHAVETCWEGQGSSEGVADAAQLLVYWGVLLVFIVPALGWLAVAGVALCLVNRLWVERRPKALLSGLGRLVFSTLELLLNTISFARVGAFALAHAALESAVFALADGLAMTAAVAVVVIGNLVVILLEGMVVSIQTTRLVLFEFFMRFFEGKGRQFRPAARPPVAGRGFRRRDAKDAED